MLWICLNILMEIPVSLNQVLRVPVCAAEMALLAKRVLGEREEPGFRSPAPVCEARCGVCLEPQCCVGGGRSFSGAP